MRNFIRVRNFIRSWINSAGHLAVLIKMCRDLTHCNLTIVGGKIVTLRCNPEQWNENRDVGITMVAGGGDWAHEAEAMSCFAHNHHHACNTDKQCKIHRRD